MKKVFINTLATSVLLTSAAATVHVQPADAATYSLAQVDASTANAFNKGKVISTKKINAEMAKLINNERKANGAALLKIDNSSAVMKGLDIRTNEVSKYFSHNRPNGKLYSTAFSTSVRNTIKGENVAMRSYNPIPEGVSPEQHIAQLLFSQWNASSQHHDNMISKSFKKTAFQVKLKYNTDKKRYYYYGVQIFKTK